MMSFFQKYKLKHYVNYAVIALFTLIFTILSLSGALHSSTQYLLEAMGISMILAVSLNLVVGLLGELSLGHAGFMCLGAYLGGKVASLLAPSLGESSPLTLLLSLAVGGVVAALAGLLIGLPALRLKGDYLAVVTLAFGEIVRVLFKNSGESFGGAQGLATPRFDRQTLFLWIFLSLLVCLFFLQNLMRSKHGRAITAIRDNEIAARASGVSVVKYKLLAFMLSSFFAGVAGVLFSFSQFNVRFDHFDYNYSIEILVMIVLGGLGSINGSLVAASLITFLNVKLADVLTGNLAILQDLVYALILILVIIYSNAPALKNFRERFNLRRLWGKIRKPKKADASVQRDDANDWAEIPTKIPMNEILSTDLSPVDSSVKARGDAPADREEDRHD